MTWKQPSLIPSHPSWYSLNEDSVPGMYLHTYSYLLQVRQLSLLWGAKEVALVVQRMYPQRIIFRKRSIEDDGAGDFITSVLSFLCCCSTGFSCRGCGMVNQYKGSATFHEAGTKHQRNVQVQVKSSEEKSILHFFLTPTPHTSYWRTAGAANATAFLNHMAPPG